jgi:dynein heavy chain
MLTMDLVMFDDAVLNICRILRVLRRPRGNLLLLGIGGSGRQSLVRLGAFLSDMIIFQIEITRKYGHTEFKEGFLKEFDGLEKIFFFNRFTTFNEIMWDIKS